MITINKKINISEAKQPKTKKTIDVKGSIVKGKTGVYSRDPHKRLANVNINVVDPKKSKHPQITEKLNNSLRTNTISGIEDISKADGGVTEGVKHLKMENSEGKQERAFFKAINNDPLIAERTFFGIPLGKDHLRESIRLNDKKTNQSIEGIQEYERLQMEKDHGRDEVKGHLMDREIGAFTLSKALGMDHMPDATVRRIGEPGKDKELGVVVRDLREQFGEKNTTITKAIELLTDREKNDRDVAYNKIYGLVKNDPKLGDKLAFDLLIGNTDRHAGNFMIKMKEGNGEFLAFDQGLSFPNSNEKYSKNDFTNQTHFLKHAGDKKLTAQFVENLNNFANSEDFDKFANYIKENIGEYEFRAFTERTAFLMDQIFNKKKTTISSMNFNKHSQRT